MAKRAALPGTAHSTTLHRLEAVILRAIRNTPGVVKLEPLYINWTGASQKRLRLQQGSARIRGGTLEAWLYLGPHKRLLLLAVRPLATVQAVQQALAHTLRRFDVEVFIRMN
jgi:hypothetical protein